MLNFTINEAAAFALPIIVNKFEDYYSKIKAVNSRQTSPEGNNTLAVLAAQHDQDH